MDQKAGDEGQAGDHPAEASIRRTIASRLERQDQEQNGEKPNPPPGHRHGQRLQASGFGVIHHTALVLKAKLLATYQTAVHETKMRHDHATANWNGSAPL